MSYSVEEEEPLSVEMVLIESLVCAVAAVMGLGIAGEVALIAADRLLAGGLDEGASPSARAASQSAASTFRRRLLPILVPPAGD